MKEIKNFQYFRFIDDNNINQLNNLDTYCEILIIGYLFSSCDIINKVNNLPVCLKEIHILQSDLINIKPENIFDKIPFGCEIKDYSENESYYTKNNTKIRNGFRYILLHFLDKNYNYNDVGENKKIIKKNSKGIMQIKIWLLNK